MVLLCGCFLEAGERALHLPDTHFAAWIQNVAGTKKHSQFLCLCDRRSEFS